MSQTVNEVFADMSKRFEQLERDYETNLSKDELDTLIKNGFNDLEAEIIYSKTLPGKIRKVVKSVSVQIWITVILIAGISVIIVLLLFLFCYIFKACKDGKSRYKAMNKHGKSHQSKYR